MRQVDRWIGVPTCAVLTILRRLGGLFRRRDPAQPPRRIAVVKLAEQGATVLAYPALVHAAEMVGPQNLFFLVFSQNRFILDLLDVVPRENVIAIRTTGMVTVVLDTLRAVVRMRRLRIDAAVDFEFFARSSAILTYLSGARMRVGYHAYHGEASYRGDLMTHRLSFNSTLHASQMFDVLVRTLEQSPRRLPACDIEPPSISAGPMPVYHSDAARVGEVEAILRETLGVEKIPPIVLLNANCSDLLPLRRWPTERYADLTCRLLERHSELAIVFTGSPDEAADAKELVGAVSSARCVSLAGRTTMEQLIALYEIADLMVTNDSGPAQYATLTSIDVITIFGPETPAVFGARSSRSHILWAGIACSPCVNAFNDRQSACQDNVCMQRISVDNVFELASRALQQRLEPGAGQA